MGPRSFISPFQPGGTAGKYRSGWGSSPSAPFRLLYCKMRGIDEASFLESPCRLDCGPLPEAVFRAEVSRQLRRHGSLRADRHKLVETPRLRDDRRRRV